MDLRHNPPALSCSRPGAHNPEVEAGRGMTPATGAHSENNECAVDSDPEDQTVGPEARILALALMDAQNAIASSLDLRTTLKVIAREALRLTRSKAAFVSLLQDGQLPIVEVWTDEGEIEMSRPWHLSTSNSLAARAIRKRQAVQWARSHRGASDMDPEEHGRFPLSRRNLSVPLLIGDEPLGALTLSHERDAPFDSRELLLCEVLAAAAAIAIQNARTHESSLSAAQSLAQERIAQDLHDSVAQDICAIRTRTEDVLQHADLTQPVRNTIEEIGAIAADRHALLLASRDRVCALLAEAFHPEEP